MASNYYVPGYAPPAGVGSREDVIRLQQQLGVRADGIWGANTQAAYDMSPINPGGAFMSYFNSMLNSLAVPTVNVDIPSQEELEARYAAALRPGADNAVDQRKTQGEAAKAEMDADAAARGMDSSTFIASMRERENDDTNADIAYIESAYTASLAGEIASAMMQYEQMKMEADVFNAQQYASAANTAMDMTWGWYSSWLANQNSTRSASGSGSSGSSGAPSGGGSGGGSGYSGLLLPECQRYVSGLSEKELNLLASSSNSYWASRRAELSSSLAALGKDFGSFLRPYYGGTRGYTK